MRRRIKQLIFIFSLVAVFAIGALIIYSATPSGKLKINPTLTPKIKMVNQENATSTSNNPVGWWKMDETTAIRGSTIADSSGYGNTGTLYTSDGSTEKSVVGKLGKGLSFDGSDDYMRTGKQVITTNVFTITVWIKPSRFGNSNAANGIVYQGTGSSDSGTLLWVGNGTLIGTNTIGGRVAGGGIGYADANAITPNVWQ